MEKKKLRVAFYGRISKRGSHQNPENQLIPCREWCEHNDYDLVEIYIDEDSGRKDIKDRPEFKRMFEDASQGKFDLVLFWSLDRFSRQGMAKTVEHLTKLKSYNVLFHSYKEPILSTENELVRDILLAVLSALAKQEAVRNSERIKAGHTRARAEGKVIGRPKLDERTQNQIAALVEEGLSNRKIAARLQRPESTLRPYIKQVRQELRGEA